MIDCTDEYIYCETFNVKNRKCRRSRIKRFLIFIILVILCGYLFYHVNSAVFNLVAEICEDYTYSASLSSINKAIFTSLSEEIKYSDLIKIEKNNDGEIVLMSSDAVKINSISRAVCENTERLLTDKLKEGIPVPIFAFSCIKLASGYGPAVQYDAITVVGVNSDFSGEFTSVGINQTLHSLYITVTCTVDIEFLYKKRSFNCSSGILISEAVLVGNVPEVYLKGAL